MTKVKYPLLNILIGLLIVALVATLYIPSIEVGEADAAKTISVMGYLAFPTEHKDVTKMLEGLYEDFNINREVWWLLLTQILALGSIAMLALYPGQKKSLSVPVLFSLVGIGSFCPNRLLHVSGFTIIGVALMLIVLLLSLYNADLLRKISKEEVHSFLRPSAYK